MKKKETRLDEISKLIKKRNNISWLYDKLSPDCWDEEFNEQQTKMDTENSKESSKLSRSNDIIEQKIDNTQLQKQLLSIMEAVVSIQKQLM